MKEQSSSGVSSRNEQDRVEEKSDHRLTDLSQSTRSAVCQLLCVTGNALLISHLGGKSRIAEQESPESVLVPAGKMKISHPARRQHWLCQSRTGKSLGQAVFEHKGHLNHRPQGQCPCCHTAEDNAQPSCPSPDSTISAKTNISGCFTFRSASCR